MLRDLEKSGAIAVREIDYFGYRKKEFTALESPQTERLGPVAIKLLDDVIDFVCRDNTAKTISEFSHNRAWDMAENGAVLSYNSVFQIFPTQVSSEIMEAVQVEVRDLEDQRAEGTPLGGNVLGKLRERFLQTRKSH
jgi:hypothetical protein